MCWIFTWLVFKRQTVGPCNSANQQTRVLELLTCKFTKHYKHLITMDQGYASVECFPFCLANEQITLHWSHIITVMYLDPCPRLNETVLNLENTLGRTKQQTDKTVDRDQKKHNNITVNLTRQTSFATSESLNRIIGIQVKGPVTADKRVRSPLDKIAFDWTEGQIFHRQHYTAKSAAINDVTKSRSLDRKQGSSPLWN